MPDETKPWLQQGHMFQSRTFYSYVSQHPSAAEWDQNKCSHNGPLPEDVPRWGAYPEGIGHIVGALKVPMTSLSFCPNMGSHLLTEEGSGEFKCSCQFCMCQIQATKTTWEFTWAPDSSLSVLVSKMLKCGLFCMLSPTRNMGAFAAHWVLNQHPGFIKPQATTVGTQWFWELSGWQEIVTQISWRRLWEIRAGRGGTQP